MPDNLRVLTRKATKLDEFIQETPSSIVRGVQKAETECKDTGAVISSSKTTTKYSTKEKKHRGVRQDIEFDISVPVESGTQTNRGIGVASGILNLGSAGQSENSKLPSIASSLLFPLFSHFKRLQTD